MSDENILTIAVYVREIRQAILAKVLSRPTIEKAILELGLLREKVSKIQPRSLHQRGLLSILNLLFQLTEDDILNHLNAIHPMKPSSLIALKFEAIN